jgi:hypothetical protein
LHADISCAGSHSVVLIPTCPHLSMLVPTRPHLSLLIHACPHSFVPVPTCLCLSPLIPAHPCLSLLVLARSYSSSVGCASSHSALVTCTHSPTFVGPCRYSLCVCLLLHACWHAPTHARLLPALGCSRPHLFGLVCTRSWLFAVHFGCPHSLAPVYIIISILVFKYLPT